MSFKFHSCSALLLSLLVLSCSIKEDRTDCPCFLTLDLEGTGAAALLEEGFRTVSILAVSGTDSLACEEFPLDAGVREYSVDVPRANVDVMVLCRGGGALDLFNGFVIPDGEPCPKLMMYNASFVPDADRIVRNVFLHRAWCELSVSLKSSYGTSPRPFRIMLEGNVCGYWVDGTPKDGPFSCYSPSSSDGRCSLGIPRQKDDSLHLAIFFLDSDEVRTFPIGEYIAESGYDWNAEDLEDIEVEVDFSLSGISFTISKWKKTLSFDITF